jgi:hypothetical protein
MNGGEEGRRTILTALEASKDPETGEKLTMQELVSNAVLLMYQAYLHPLMVGPRDLRPRGIQSPPSLCIC